MNPKIVGRFAVPVDDKIHEIKVVGEPKGIVASVMHEVEFWAETYFDMSEFPARKFIIVGTGHDIQPGWRHIGTAPRIGGLVWHLIEVLS